jgi:formate hydrogenlyase transcriptional activator
VTSFATLASSAPEVDIRHSIAAKYESLIRIAAAVRSQQEPKDLFQLLVSELGKVIQFDAIAQYDEGSNKIHWHLCAGCRKRESVPSIDKEETLAAWVVKRQEPVAILDLDRETRFGATADLMREAGLKSVCAFPLSTVHRKLGSLVIASVRRDAYSPEEIRFCALVADQIALAMDDAYNFLASQRAQERLELLLDLTNRVVSNLNLRDVLREVSANIRRVMQCDGVGIDLPSPEDKKLRLYALDFPDNPGFIEEGFEPPADEKASALRVFRSGKPVILSKQEIDEEPSVPKVGAQSLAHVPLMGRKGIAGVLTLGSWREHAFASEDLAFLEQIGKQVAIAVENAWAFGEVSDLTNKLAQEKLYLEDEIRSELKFEEIVGKSEALRRVLQEVETVAPTDSTVLIYGETGTGKELIARAVHNLSSRHSNGFVKLNCAAIPTGLLESEMFGHERGAFTGAIAQRVGRFELAHRGTMFLDEVGEIPLELQPKLLRVLQEREFERLGSTKTLRSDARLIAATNRDLETLVGEQKFRSDLYYRLNVFPVRVPALRERPEDIPLLVRHFVQQYSRQMSKVVDTIAADTMATLVKYPWPGNIRELQNVIERAVILAKGPLLTVPGHDLHISNGSSGGSSGTSAASIHGSPRNMREALDDTERKQIVEALEQTNWTVAGPNGAAAKLGMKRSTLQSRMQKLGIRVSRTGA